MSFVLSPLLSRLFVTRRESTWTSEAGRYTWHNPRSAPQSACALRMIACLIHNDRQSDDLLYTNAPSVSNDPIYDSRPKNLVCFDSVVRSPTISAWRKKI